MNTNPMDKEVETEQLDYSLILLRIVSLILLAFSIAYWTKLVGVVDPTLRFDTLSNAWKIAATSLVVLQAVASLGLWGGWRWGVVLWVLVALIEFMMYAINSSVFGSANTLLVFHGVSLTMYFATSVYSRWMQNRQRDNS